MPKDPSQKMMQVVQVLICKQVVKKSRLQLTKKKKKVKKGKKKEMDKEQNRKVMANLLKHHVLVQQMLLRCDVDAVRAEILRAELVELGLLVDPALPERQPLLVLEPEPVHRHLELLAQQILLLPTLRLGELVGDHLPAAVGVELAPVARGVRGARRDVDANRARIGAELRPVLLRQPPPARRLRPELWLRRCRQERRHRRAAAGRGGAVRARGAAPGRALLAPRLPAAVRPARAQWRRDAR